MTLKKGIRIVLMSLIVSYLITGFLLLFTALLLYKLEPEQSLVELGILVIYVLCSFLGGLLAGKGLQNRKFLWGFTVGALYFILLILASAAAGGGIRSSVPEILTVLALCLGGGMLGGMLA